MQNTNKTPIIIINLKEAYKEWHKIFEKINKFHRYSLGLKIDNLFLEILEKLLQAQYTNKENKYESLNIAHIKMDSLKFLLLILFEVGGVSQKDFINLNTKIEEMGKMLYGWKQQSVAHLENKTLLQK